MQGRFLTASLAFAALCALAACGGATAPSGESAHQGGDAAHTAGGEASGNGGEAHARHHGAGGAHGGGDRVPHGGVSLEQYVARLEDPARAAWQEPERLIAALAIPEGARVADVGTGSGYFLPFLSRAAGPEGHVVGVDIDDALLDFARRRIAQEHLTNAEVLLGRADDPGLAPGSFDLVLVVDTYHHVADRAPWLAKLRASLSSHGRLVIVDFRDGELPVGPPPAHKILRARVERELTDAGFSLVRSHEFLRYQYVLEAAVRGASVTAATPESMTGATTEQPSIVLDEDLTPTDGGFPAISADASRIAVAVVDPDGARGAPNLLLRVVRAQDGAVVDELPILLVQEGARLEAGSASERVRRVVQQRHARALQALREGDFRGISSIYSRATDTGDALDLDARGVHVSYTPDSRVLVVRDTDGTVERARRVLPPTAPRRAGCDAHEPYVLGIWYEPTTRVVVLKVGYHGSPQCPAPAPSDHVFVLVR